MIYFIRNCGNQAIKIGFSENPEDRLPTLQTGCSDELELLVMIPGSLAEEDALHQKFAHLKIRGEWFRPESELMAEIERHRFGLTPVRGTNRENLAIPQHPLLRSFRKQRLQFPELAFMTSMAVRHAVSISVCECRQDPELNEALIGTRDPAYQVMRWNNGAGPGCQFWNHHLWERPQWYRTPEEACAAYIASYAEWIKNEGSPS